jgi:hypothetical protein
VAVDAAGVDAVEDGDAVAGAAGDLGEGTPASGHRDTAPWRRL